jgi:hypothetical protein
VIFATYAKPKIWYRIALMFVMLLMAPSMTVLLFYHRVQEGSPNVFLPTMVVFAWLFSIPAANLFRVVLKQVVYNASRLIWIENEQLVWRDPTFFSVPCADIVQVSCGIGGKFAQLDIITVHTRDGAERKIATDALAETCEDVVKAIRKYLRIQSSAIS